MSKKLTPKQWQIVIGQAVVRLLHGVIYNCRATNYFEIISYPEDDSYTLRIFCQDELGDVYDSSGRIGFERMRIEIVYPNILAVSEHEYGEQTGGPILFSDYSDMTKHCKLLLENIICNYCLKRGIINVE